MADLSTVYQEHIGPVQSARRLYIGTGVFLLGALFLVLGIIIATTNLVTPAWKAWEIGGVLAGFGLPGTFLGLLTVVPLSNTVKQRIRAGIAVTVLGVVLFLYAFPDMWHGDTQNLTAVVVITYALGTGTILFYAFRQIATFDKRNSPGGKANVNVTIGDEDTEKDSEQEMPSFGSGAGISTESRDDDPMHNDATDDGIILEDDEDDEPSAAEKAVSAPGEQHEHHDKYCGSCAHFEYVETSTGIQPYCGLYDEQMDDLEACPEWASN